VVIRRHFTFVREKITCRRHVSIRSIRVTYWQCGSGLLFRPPCIAD